MTNIKFDFLFKKYNYSINMVTFTDNENNSISKLHKLKKLNVDGLEFEIGFGKNITQSKFMNVLKMLKSNIGNKYKFTKSTTLDISVYENSSIHNNSSKTECINPLIISSLRLRICSLTKS